MAHNVQLNGSSVSIIVTSLDEVTPVLQFAYLHGFRVEIDLRDPQSSIRELTLWWPEFDSASDLVQWLLTVMALLNPSSYEADLTDIRTNVDGRVRQVASEAASI